MSKVKGAVGVGNVGENVALGNLMGLRDVVMEHSDSL